MQAAWPIRHKQPTNIVTIYDLDKFRGTSLTK